MTTTRLDVYTGIALLSNHCLSLAEEILVNVSDLP